MILLFTLNYLVVCALCFLCAGWMIVKVLREEAPTTDDDNGGDGFGGVPSGFKLPVFDPPGGCHLDDLLVDRMPLEESEVAVSGAELTTTAHVPLAHHSARKPPVSADPPTILSGWYSKQSFSFTI